jgi:hypothetical protein
VINTQQSTTPSKFSQTLAGAPEDSLKFLKQEKLKLLIKEFVDNLIDPVVFRQGLAELGRLQPASL